MAPMTSTTPFQIMKSIIVKFEKSTNFSKPAMCGFFTGMTKTSIPAPITAHYGWHHLLRPVQSASLSLVVPRRPEVAERSTRLTNIHAQGRACR